MRSTRVADGAWASWASVPMADGAQSRDVLAPDARHQPQVVLALPALVAHRAELAQRAVVDAVGLGLLGAREGGEEPGADTPVVGGEVGRAQRAPLADTQQHVHRGRHVPLDGRDRLGVEAELQHVGRLLGAGQLGVQRLVAPFTQRGPLRDPLQEVGAAPPVTRHERRLVDDLGPGPHGLDRRPCRALEVPPVGADDVDHLPPGGSQSAQVVGLVLLPLAAEELAVVVGQVRARAQRRARPRGPAS